MTRISNGPSSSGGRPAQASVPAELLNRARLLVEQQAGWPADTFVLEPAEGWSGGAVALLMAHPTVNRPYSIPVAVLPNGELVTPYTRRAFDLVVRAAFPEPGPQDAHDLAQLAVLFGDFGAPVGDVVEAIPGSLRGGGMLPRESAEVTLKTAGSGASAISQLRFYGLDAELNHLYDCTVRIEPKAIRLAARRVAP